MDLTNAQYTKIKNILPSIEALIRNELGEERYQDRVDKVGFAGLVLTSPTAKDPARLFYVRTRNGLTGEMLPFPDIKKSNLSNLINNA